MRGHEGLFLILGNLTSFVCNCFTAHLTRNCAGLFSRG